MKINVFLFMILMSGSYIYDYFASFMYIHIIFFTIRQIYIRSG